MAGHDVISPPAKRNLSTFIDVMILCQHIIVTHKRVNLKQSLEETLIFSFTWSWEFIHVFKAKLSWAPHSKWVKWNLLWEYFPILGFRMGYSQLRRRAIKTSRQTISFNDLPCSATLEPLLCYLDKFGFLFIFANIFKWHGWEIQLVAKKRDICNSYGIRVLC